LRSIQPKLGLFRATWVGYVAALVAVALVSVAIEFVRGFLSIPNISMLYLIAVLATATAFGSGPAVLASFAAFLIFDWFFVQPYFSLTVKDPGEWFALLLFLLTAIITGELAAGQRRRARQAEQREREAVVLYDVVRLVEEPEIGKALHAVAERLRQELQLEAVAIELDDGERPVAREAAGDTSSLPRYTALSQTSGELLSRGAAPTGEQRGMPGRWVRIVPPRVAASGQQASYEGLRLVPVVSLGRRVGTIVLKRAAGAPDFDPADDRLLSAVAAQIGLAVERGRLRREATENEILRRSDELKTAMLNAVSHDLRTPLSSIIASAGSLLQRDLEWSDSERREFAEAIEHEARRLNQLVGNLLDLSRIQAGSLHLEKGWYDLGALVDDVLGRLRPLVASHRVVVDIPEDLPPVPLSYVEVDQVLSNLIENSTKYAPRGTEIAISATRRGDAVQVAVSNQGPQIPPAAMGRLFEPFYRVPGGTGQPKGTGLGLAVARGLVEAHGGQIKAENRPSGGVSFIFTLPLSIESGGQAKSQRQPA
jgi:two-component system, OmpR family, sensor histidine kinase KdpD